MALLLSVVAIAGDDAVVAVAMESANRVALQAC